MAGTLPAGSVAIDIIGQDGSFQQVIGKVNTKMKTFQKTVNNVGATTMPGFQGMLANFRDISVTVAAVDHVFRRVSSVVKSAVTEFSNFGNSIAKMSRRSGIGANDLSLLGYAAEQSGASTESLGKSMTSFQRNLAAAGQGNTAAIEAFGKLGINFAKLQTLDKKDQFLAVADAIGKLGDETLQTQAAMKLFGKTGSNMLPMFQEGADGIRRLMQEADQFGIGISDADAAKAEKLNSAFTKLQRSFQGLRLAIGSAFAGAFTKTADWMSSVINNVRKNVVSLLDSVRQWYSANQALISSILKVGGAVMVGFAAWKTWQFVSPMIKMLNLSLMKTIALQTLAMLLNPFGLMVTGIAAATGALLYFTRAGSELMSWFGDIAAMIQEGRILDAVKLMWLDIQLLFEEGKLALMNKWDEVAAAISEPFMAIYDAIASAVQPAVEWLVDTFSGLGGWISDQFATPMQWLCDMFGGWWSYIKGGWEALMNDLGYVVVGTWWTIASGINTAWAWLRTQWNNLLTGIQKTFLSVAKGLINAMTAVMRALDFTGTIQGLVNQANSALDEMIDGVTKRAKVKADEIADTKQMRQAALDEMAMNSLNKVDAVKANAPKTNDRIEGLKLEIAKLKEPVHQPSEKTKQITDTAQRIAQGGTSSIVAGSMNKHDILGGALAYMASEKDHSEEIAENTTTTNELLREVVQNTRNSGMTFE